MRKLCKNCQGEFEITQKRHIKTKVFCGLLCSQDWWKKQRNKTGRFVGESKKLGIYARSNLHLNGDQIQLILGSLLGDGYIGEKKNKNSSSFHYAEGHSARQSEYLLHKLEALNGFVVQKNLTHIEPNGFSPIPKVSITSVVHEDFRKIHALFYKGENGKPTKFICKKTLELLNPLALIYWYLDDGYLSKKGTIELATYSFTESEHTILEHWMTQKFGIHPKITFNASKKSFLLRLGTQETKKFLSLILPFRDRIPASMHYKLPRIQHSSTK